MAPSPRPLRLTVVLSGGASLGAYHAGVVAALVTARNALDDTSSLRIDAIGGASAGALVSLLGGWAVAAGRDPVWLLHEAWVERVDIDLLRGTDGRAPLDFDGLRDRFVELLAEAPRAAVAGAPIAVDVALTGLRGLTYPVRGLRGEDSIRASTYADWFTRRLGADADLAAVVDPAGASLLDAALASASNPGGFPPRLLDRSADRDVYAQHGIDPLPDPMTLWFSDGGLVLSEPVGRVVAAGADDAPGQRVAVLVDPRSEDPDGARSWSDPDLDPGWVDGPSGPSRCCPPTSSTRTCGGSSATTHACSGSSCSSTGCCPTSTTRRPRTSVTRCDGSPRRRPPCAPRTTSPTSRSRARGWPATCALHWPSWPGSPASSRSRPT